MKKLLCVLLSVLMLVGTLPFSALAAEEAAAPKEAAADVSPEDADDSYVITRDVKSRNVPANQSGHPRRRFTASPRRARIR